LSELREAQPGISESERIIEEGLIMNLISVWSPATFESGPQNLLFSEGLGRYECFAVSGHQKHLPSNSNFLL
jgi:hypothetical protein